MSQHGGKEHRHGQSTTLFVVEAIAQCLVISFFLHVPCKSTSVRAPKEICLDESVDGFLALMLVLIETLPLYHGAHNVRRGKEVDVVCTPFLSVNSHPVAKPRIDVFLENFDSILSVVSVLLWYCESIEIPRKTPQQSWLVCIRIMKHTLINNSNMFMIDRV